MKVRFSHLSLSERRKIERWRQAKLSPDEMARRLGRHRSTIVRELRRNHFHDSDIPKLSGYWCVVARLPGWTAGTAAQAAARSRAAQPGRALPTLWLDARADRRPDALQERSPPGIHRHACSGDGRRAELWRHLPSGRRRRRGYRLRKRPPPGSAFSSGLRSAPRSSRIASSPGTGVGQDRRARWRGAGLSNDPVPFRQKHGPADITIIALGTSRLLVALKDEERRDPADHGPDRPGSDAPAPACLPIDHLRSRLRVHRLAAPAGRGRHADVVLRGAVTLAERCCGERRQAPQTLALP